MALPSHLNEQFLHTHMANHRGFCIELLVATAFLAVAASILATDVRSSADWKQSKILADKAIAQAKRRAQTLKEPK